MLRARLESVCRSKSFRQPARSNETARTSHVNRLLCTPRWSLLRRVCGRRPACRWSAPLKHPTAGPSGVELGQRTNLSCPSSTAAPRLSSLALQPRHDSCARFSRLGGPHQGMDHEAWRLWGPDGRGEPMGAPPPSETATRGWLPQPAKPRKARKRRRAQLRKSSGGLTGWGSEKWLHVGEPLSLATSLHWMGPRLPVALPPPTPPLAPGRGDATGSRGSRKALRTSPPGGAGQVVDARHDSAVRADFTAPGHRPTCLWEDNKWCRARGPAPKNLTAAVVAVGSRGEEGPA